MSKGTAKIRAVVMEFGRFTKGSMRQAERKSKKAFLNFDVLILIENPPGALTQELAPYEKGW